MDSSSKSSDGRVRFDDAGNVQVNIRLRNTSDETLQRLRKLGANIEIVNSDWNVVQGWAPITALDQIASPDEVRKITPPDYGVTNTGPVNSEGDPAEAQDLNGDSTAHLNVTIRINNADEEGTLSAEAEVTIDLTSSVDTYLYLRSGSSTSGTALHSNDDIVSGNTDSRIVATLAAGTYTIEATTYSPNTTGSLTVSVRVGGL